MFNPSVSPAQKRIYMLMNKFRDLRESNVLDDDGYFKELVILAYELGKEDLVDDAISMLLKVDVNYFGRRQMRQAEEDFVYRSIIYALKEIIEEHKEFNTNTLMPTQAPADA
jgi:hypothetical protein